MIHDPVLAGVQRFIDAVRSKVAQQTDELRALISETRSALTELQTRAVPSGLQGERGLSGLDGAPGRDGVDGKDGRDGTDGASGPQGERGAPGERGVDGLQGRDGAPGAAGALGPQGERGVQGERGADGLHGRDGAPGPQGERGADGIATLEELDARIEARFAELQVRTFADVYQGVFETEKSYARGLLATWGGSLWLSLHETRSKPGENSDWRLVVKRGADGVRK